MKSRPTLAGNHRPAEPDGPGRFCRSTFSERTLRPYFDTCGAYDAGTSTPSWRACSRGHNLLSSSLRVPAPTARRRWLPVYEERHPRMKIALVAQYSTPWRKADRVGDDARLVEHEQEPGLRGPPGDRLRSAATAGELPERAWFAGRASASSTSARPIPAGDDPSWLQAGRRVQRAAARGVGDQGPPRSWCTPCAGPAAWPPCQPPATSACRWCRRSTSSASPSAATGRSRPGPGEPSGIRLEPAIGRTVDAVVASSYDEESDLARLGIPVEDIQASSRPESTPASSPPRALPT